jgi:hypothetical protein
MTNQQTTTRISLSFPKMKIKLGPVSRGVLDICRDFAQWTSTNGVPHIFMADKLWIAFFWSIIFFAALALASWQLVVTIMRYLSFPINMDARVSDLNFLLDKIVFSEF